MEKDLHGGGTDGPPHSGLGSVGCEYWHFGSRHLYREDERNHLLGLVQGAGGLGCSENIKNHIFKYPQSNYGALTYME